MAVLMESVLNQVLQSEMTGHLGMESPPRMHTRACARRWLNASLV
jgi:hypothetical protein